MKKKYLFVIFNILFLLALASCKKSTINQKETYQKIKNLCEGYSTDNVSFSSVLSCEEKNIILTNTGSLTKEEDSYTYSYSYQYLNKIGSGATSLVSTETGSIHGSKTEIMESGFEISTDFTVVSLDIANSFKTYVITENEDTYSMKGYITRNTIIKNTKNLDDDIRFNYELITDKDVTTISKLIISYSTIRFDSVIVTITF